MAEILEQRLLHCGILARESPQPAFPLSFDSLPFPERPSEEPWIVNRAGCVVYPNAFFTPPSLGRAGKGFVPPSYQQFPIGYIVVARDHYFARKCA